MNLAMLIVLGKPAELKLHVTGALTNGVTVKGIKEVLLQATVYCGISAGLEAFKVAHEVLMEGGHSKPGTWRQAVSDATRFHADMERGHPVPIVADMPAVQEN